MIKTDEKTKNTPGNTGASNYFNNSRSGGITIMDDSELLPQKRKTPGCCGGGNVLEGQPDPSAVQSQ